MSIFTYKLYTDGSCFGNPGAGGWAYVLINGQNETRRHGGHPMTTNNRMELTGVISGLKQVPEKASVAVFTDSQYITNAFNKKWVFNWKKNGWMRNDGELKNKELWIELYNLVSRRTVSFNWVKGHNGDHYNEMCDRAATAMSEYYQNHYDGEVESFPQVHEEEQRSLFDVPVVSNLVDQSVPEIQTVEEAGPVREETGSALVEELESVYCALEQLLGLTFFRGRPHLCGSQFFCDYCGGDFEHPCAKSYIRATAAAKGEGGGTECKESGSSVTNIAL